MNYRIYTDGSTRNNGKDGNVGGYGFLVLDQYNNIVDAYAETNIENTTNNRMELTAIVAALFMWEKRMRNKDEGSYIELYSDSEYALKSLFSWSHTWAMNGWKTTQGTEVKNQDLIKNFYDKQWSKYLDNMVKGKRNSWSKFSYSHIHGHNGNKYNELADKLATGQISPESIIAKNRDAWI